MENLTTSQYNNIIDYCRNLFLQKTHDYGTAWRILRLPSITDQIFIKAKRIRSIQEKGVQLVDEDPNDEFVAIINYCLIALMQIELINEGNAELEIPVERVSTMYQHYAESTFNLLLNKNHDYGEVWREMRVSSITDIILMKILRTKQIEDLKGHTLVSEGVSANYQDMINYSVFALILSNFKGE
ncbi:MAG: hypothetical protein RLZZ175_2813 [Bacteroidota bacterium]|jgi:hypothetical protein